MRYSRFLEVTVTKFLLATVLFTVVIVITLYAAVLYYKLIDIAQLAAFVDASFKTIAVLVGAAWTLNRYFVQRIDALKIGVDADVNIIPSSSFGNDTDFTLLIYRLDIVNTGASRILPFGQFLRIDAVYPSGEGTQYKPIYRWPEMEEHLGGPIEPGSWSAINDAISIADEVQAVRLYLQLHFSDEQHWTWHKTFNVSNPTSEKSYKDRSLNGV
jgi:hypothetical protein